MKPAPKHPGNTPEQRRAIDEIGCEASIATTVPGAAAAKKRPRQPQGGGGKMKLDWQFSKDEKRAAAVYPLMVSDNRAGTRAEIRLRADDTGRWEIEIAAEFGRCRKRGQWTYAHKSLENTIIDAESALQNIVEGHDTPQCTRDGANRFAAELAEEEMRWEDE